MIGRATAEKLLAVARQARDRVDFKVNAGLDHSAASKTERAYLDILVREAHVAMREGPDHEFAARQHLQTVQVQQELLAGGYDALELAARVVCRVAKEGDAVELADVIANLEKVVREQALKRELAKRGTSPDSADALRYAVAAVQVDIGLKPLPPAPDDGRFQSQVKDFVRRTGAHPGLGLPYGRAQCPKCYGTGNVAIDLGEPPVRTIQPCHCTFK